MTNLEKHVDAIAITFFQNNCCPKRKFMEDPHYPHCRGCDLKTLCKLGVEDVKIWLLSEAKE